MDAAGKLLGVVKGLPLSMLGALSIVTIAAALYPPLQVGLPAPYGPLLPLLAVFFVAMTLFGALAHVVNHLQASRSSRMTADRLRHEQIYAPLAGLFVRTHVTACTGVLAPYLRHRLSNAWGELRHRRTLIGFRRAFRILGDRRTSTTAAIEYGREFPIKAIHDLVVANPALAGAKLINLVRRADLSRYENNVGSGRLTDEEYELFEHIDSEYQRLEKRFT